MANDQNTIAGTNGGGSLITQVGNSVLSAFDKVTNVAWNGLEVYGSFRERLMALGLLKKEEVTAPQQTSPPNNISNFSDYLSDPKRVQQMLLMATAGTALIVGAVWLMKRK